MGSLKQAFQKAVPNADERELLRREYGAEAIAKLYQGAVDLEDDPASAFAKSLSAQLRIIRSKGGSRQSANLRYVTTSVGGMAEGINARHLLNRSSARHSTVTGLLEKVQEKRVLLVSGPPNSGKTGLAQLCFQMAKQPNNVYDPASVVFINASNVGPGEEEINFLQAFEQDIKRQQPDRGPVSLKEILHGFGTPHSSPARDDVTELTDLSHDTSKPLKTLVIVDEAQNTFPLESGAAGFWRKVKSISSGEDDGLVQILLFASRGSNPFLDALAQLPTSPQHFSPDLLVALRNTNQPSSYSLGFSDAEVDEVFMLTCGFLAVDPRALLESLGLIRSRAAGHVGVTMMLLDILVDQWKPGSASHIKAWQSDIITNFLGAHNLALRLGGKRGFPPHQSFENADQGSKFLVALMHSRDDQVSLSELQQLDLEHQHSLVRKATSWAKSGWLAMTTSPSDSFYEFCTPLHAEYFLLKMQLRRFATNMPADLLTFILSTMEKVSPEEMQATLSTGFNGSIHECGFEYAFLRAAESLLPRGQHISTRVGKNFGIDAYLDAMISPLYWGIEFLRDASNLKGHLDRFKTEGPGGRYADFIESGLMQEWWFVDFRNSSCTIPVVAHPQLMTVTFSQDFKIATATCGEPAQTFTCYLVGTTRV